jgi:hypothetical protein
MATTAPIIQYIKEWVPTFEQRASQLVSSTTTNHVMQGGSAVFLVVGSGGAVATTRGSNGKIAGRQQQQTQNTCTLQPFYDKTTINDFDVFAGQGDQRRILQLDQVGVLNRSRDTNILGVLDTATVDTGAAITGSVDVVAKALAILGVAQVPIEEMDNMFAVVSPAFWAYLMQTTEFSNGDYVDVKPFNGPVKKYWRWFGLNWIMSPLVTGVGTASEKCYIYHRNAIGHATDSENVTVAAGFDEEDRYSWATAAGFWGTKLLQNSGVVQILHDGSAYVGS